MKLFIIILLIKIFIINIYGAGSCDYEIATSICTQFQDIGTPANPLIIYRCRSNGRTLWCREEYDAAGAPTNYCCSNIRNFNTALDELEDLFNNDRFGTPLDPDEYTTCVDNYPNCKNMLQYCNVVIHQTNMKTNCALSCNFCGPNVGLPVKVQNLRKQCIDNPTANCYKLKYLCQDTNYYDFMVKECPVTCNKCSDPLDWNNQTSTASTPTRTIIICYDRDKKCPTSRSFCNNSIKKNYYRHACKRSCGYCH